MEEDRLPKKMEDLILIGRKPRRRCANEVRKNLEKRGIQSRTVQEDEMWKDCPRWRVNIQTQR